MIDIIISVNIFLLGVLMGSLMGIFSVFHKLRKEKVISIDDWVYEARRVER